MSSRFSLTAVREKFLLVVPFDFFKPSSSHKGSVLPFPHRNTVHKEHSILSALPRVQKLHTSGLPGISNKLVVAITSNLFNHRHDIMLVEHRPRTITPGHVFEPFAYLADIQSTPQVKRM